ncbi:hypothetical protein N1851_006431 [Merluccius polli]|uniref:Uncharacterized protein n=1 Tax=Merluccius polli TaxID=89951 RepID=A0AA47N5Q4_MERPO|nr:hypothetical protein N1851_006431 [Merluccius polli]
MSHLTTPAPTPPSFHINGVPLQTVDHFTYLGSTLSSCCSLNTEIHTRINKASSSFGCLRSRVYENSNLKVSTRVAVYNAVCLSTLLYGAESWTPYHQHITNLEAFHIRCLQKILSLSWEDLLYSQLMGTKRSAGGQKRHFKDYTRDILKGANIPLTQLETLALDRSAWQVTCATAVSQIHQSNQDRRSKRRTQRHQWAAEAPDWPRPRAEAQVSLCIKAPLPRPTTDGGGSPGRGRRRSAAQPFRSAAVPQRSRSAALTFLGGNPRHMTGFEVFTWPCIFFLALNVAEALG